MSLFDFLKTKMGLKVEESLTNDISKNFHSKEMKILESVKLVKSVQENSVRHEDMKIESNSKDREKEILEHVKLVKSICEACSKESSDRITVVDKDRETEILATVNLVKSIQEQNRK